MQKFVSVHPIITQINPNGNGHYLVHETLKFFGISISFTYPVSIEINRPERLVIMRARVIKLVHIEMKFILSADEEDTLITESIQFRSILPIKFLLHSIFKKQHTQLFRNIEKKE